MVRPACELVVRELDSARVRQGLARACATYGAHVLLGRSRSPTSNPAEYIFAADQQRLFATRGAFATASRGRTVLESVLAVDAESHGTVFETLLARRRRSNAVRGPRCAGDRVR